MTPPSSLSEQVGGRGKPKTLLDKIAKRFGDVALRIKTEDEEGDVGSLVDYSKDKTGTIVFVGSRNSRDIIDIARIIDDLNEFRRLLNDLKPNQGTEEVKSIMGDYSLNADNAKRAASSARTTSRNPEFADTTQNHLINLGGLLKLVQLNIIDLKKYKSVIANWSNLVDTSPS